MIKVMTQKILHNRKYLLNGYFLTVLPGALFRAQAGNLFTKMSHHKYLTVFQKCLLPVKKREIHYLI